MEDSGEPERIMAGAASDLRDFLTRAHFHGFHQIFIAQNVVVVDSGLWLRDRRIAKSNKLLNMQNPGYLSSYCGASEICPQSGKCQPGSRC